MVRAGRGQSSYLAFLPAPLPPALSWTAGLAKAVADADRSLGRLAGVGQTLPNPHLLMGSFKQREAVLSSRIEGTQASLSDLLLFEVAPEGEAKPDDVREVSNYVRALEHGLARQKTLPLSLRLIREMHEILMRGAGGITTPGEFRRSQNWIGPPGCTINSATFVPAPPEELAEALAAFERFLHEKNDLPLLVRLALMHYQFEAIHPFLDGNGRIGRLLITLMLCLDGVLPGPLLYLSAFFEKHRPEYYRGLLRVSMEGAWSEWIEFFAHGVAEQSKDAVVRAERLLELRTDFRKRLLSPRTPTSALRLADELFARPALSVAQAAKLLGVTHRAGQLNVNRLVAAGILREITGKARGRVYVAEEIVRAVE